MPWREPGAKTTKGPEKEGETTEGTGPKTTEGTGPKTTKGPAIRTTGGTETTIKTEGPREREFPP